MFDVVQLDEMVGVMAKAARSDVGFVSDDELLSTALGLERLRRFLDATEGHVLAHLDATGVCDVQFGMRTGRWLAHEAQLPAGVANERVRVAVKLSTTLPVTGEALSDGRIGFDHARTLSHTANGRIGEEIAAMEAELLAPIPHTSFERWRQELAGVSQLLDQDGGFDPDRDPTTHSRTRFHRGSDGRLYFDGTLVGADAASVEEAVNARADELFLRYTRDHERCPDIDIPSRSALQALALAELIRWGHSAHRGGTTVEPATDVTVVMHTNDPFRRATTLHGARLSDQVMEFLQCNAEFAALIIDDLGVPLDLGRSHRYANRAQRRAVHVRDGCCVFPGCSVPVHRCDLHHVRVWNDGGPTDMINLAPLCRHHHRVSHRQGWAMYAHGTHFTWTTPTGQTLDSRAPPHLATA